MKKTRNIIKEQNEFSYILIIAFYALLPALSMLQGCKKFVEVPPPTSQLVTASVFNNDAAATSAVTEIYTEMYNNSESPYMALNNGTLADELTSYATGGPQFQLYTNRLTSDGNFGPWQTAYSYIYQANAVIIGLQQYSGASPAVKRQLTGEAYFIRALWHFYLTNLYGATPIALTTDYTVTSKLSRSPRLQVLQQVVADLQIAQGLLSKNYIDASDTTVTTDRVRPNRAVATALLARAYLYLGDYDNHNVNDYAKADSAANAVINNSTYSLCANLSGLNSVFLANSSEAIWQLNTPLPANSDTQDGNLFILLAAPGQGEAGINTISPQLLSAFEPNDQRMVNWIGSITEGTSTYYFPYKYKVANTYVGTEYTMVLRLAEQYLIRAEVQAHGAGNNIPGAIGDLNVIRNRAGLPNYSGANDQASVLAAILHERQVELFTEWGARWFDLNRTGNTNNVMGSSGENVCHFKGGTWNPDDHQELYPIPQTDIQVDVNLTQNPGYF